MEEIYNAEDDVAYTLQVTITKYFHLTLFHKDPTLSHLQSITQGSLNFSCEDYMLEGVGKKIGIASAILGVGTTGVWGLGSRNPETQAGYIGYRTQGAIFGKSEFLGLQTGPTSPGRGWLYEVKNISITPYAYEEDFPLDRAPLSKDGLPIQFHMTTTWRVNPARVKEFVEQFTTMKGNEALGEIEKTAYNDFMKQPIRSIALDEISKRPYLGVSSDLVNINSALLHRANEYAKSTPFEILAITVGNIQFPVEVRQAVATRLAKAQELERMATELEITKKRAEQRVAEAEGIAKSQQIIAGTLTEPYLAHEAIEAQKDLAKSGSSTFVYIPTNYTGVPILTSQTPSPDNKAKEQPKK